MPNSGVNFNNTNVSIDTRDRVSGIPENCVIQFDSGFNIQQIRLVSIELPISYYNVRNISTKYLRIDFDENDGLGEKTAIVLDAPLSLGIEVGYTLAEFITAVQTAINLASTSTIHTYSVTYSYITNKITISNVHVSGENFTLKTKTGTNKSSRLATYLGFTNTTDKMNQNSYTGSNVLNIDTNNLIDYNGTTIKMPVGSYTFNEFVTQLQTILGVGTTVVLDNITNKMTITQVASFTLDFATGLNYPISSFNTVLGYTDTDLSGTNTYTGTNSVNLGGENYIYLKSEAVTGNDQGIVTSNIIDRNILSRIQIDQPTDGIVFFTNSTLENVDISNIPNTTNQINFRLSFYRDQEVNLRGLDYSFVLNVTFN